MPAPELVLFDLDDVLAHYDHATRVAALASRVGATGAAVQAALFDSGLEHDTDLGRVDTEGHFAGLSRRLGTRVTLEDGIAARAVAMTVDARVLALAHAVARRSRVAILTNNGLFLRDHLAAMCPALFPLFNGRVFCSAQFGIGKPDPDIFLRCLALLDATPENTLFIDDKAANADGARRAGLAAIHHTGAEALLPALARHGYHEDFSHAL